jgi:molybdopterin converting factor small subunit
LSVTINIHKAHRDTTDGLEEVNVEGNTVKACLDSLLATYPGMKEKLFDKKGLLLNTIEVYINMESAYPDELAKPVQPGDEIHLAVMLSGG